MDAQREPAGPARPAGALTLIAQLDTATSTASTAFLSPSARRRYWSLTAATFLIFVTGSCIAYLSRVFAAVGFNEAQIGVILSSGAIPIVAFTLLAGRILGRFGPHGVACSGIAMTLLGYASLQLTVENGSFLFTLVAVAVMIGGVGLFMPAGFLLVRALVHPRKLVQYVGIYSAMLQVPALFGPLLAEITFSRYGLHGFFYLTALPCLIGLVLMLVLRPGEHSRPAGGNTTTEDRYFALLCNPNLAQPYLGGIAAGALFGVTQAFVALLLAGPGIGVHYFFTPFAAAYLITRFFLLRIVEGFDKAVLISAGILMMAFGLAIMWVAGGSSTTVIAAALIFGTGYSVTYPVAIVWASEMFPAERRPKPVALFNAIFTFGVYGSPVVAGAMLKYAGTTVFYAVIVAAGLLATIPLLAGRQRAA